MISENSPVRRSSRLAMALIGLSPTPQLTQYLVPDKQQRDHISPGINVTSGVFLVHHSGLSKQSWPDGQVNWAVVYLGASQLVCYGWEKCVCTEQPGDMLGQSEPPDRFS